MSCTKNNVIQNPKIPVGSYSEAQSNKILDSINSLTEDGKKCVDSFISKYQDKLLKHCEATKGGKNIGGGCYHVAYAWSISTSVLDKAFTMCQNSNK
jgi:hypothetical protein